MTFVPAGISLLVLFGAAVVSCAVRGLRRVAGRPGYLRLGVLCAAMLPMLVPVSASATPTAAPAMPSGHGSQRLMAASDTAMPMSSSAVRAIDLLLIAALLVLAAARLAGSSRAGQTLHCRLHTLCEVAMAATTGCLLATML